MVMALKDVWVLFHELVLTIALLTTYLTEESEFRIKENNWALLCMPESPSEELRS